MADWIGLDTRQIEPLLDRASHDVWRKVAELILTREFAKVAELFAKAGLKEIEAEARVRAAEALLGRKQLDDAAAQVEQALIFFRSVGATRFIREAEQLLAAASHQEEQAARPPRLTKR